MYFGFSRALLILWAGIVYIRGGPNLSGVRRAGSSRVSGLWRAIQGRVDAPSCKEPATCGEFASETSVIYSLDDDARLVDIRVVQHRSDAYR